MDVKLKNLSMKFNSNTVLHDISITINSGELVTLLGPSGCGKSTTLFLLAGLYKPSSGEIYFGDDMVVNEEPEERGIGMVFQNYALYPHMTVLKNIMFPLKMAKVPKNEAIKRATEIAKVVHVDGLLDRKPGQLSGGQQQRVAIARALVKNPKLLLLDEPLSNLDARLRIDMREEIRRIQQTTKVTAIFVTHDQEEAMSISDHIIVMNGGHIQQYSTPEKLYTDPENLFVAKFIGTPKINVINSVNIKGHNYILGIRAEDVLLNPEEPFVSGKVKYIERTGRDILVKITCSDEEIITYADKNSNINVGDSINIGADREKIHWFDKDSEKRVKPESDWYDILSKSFKEN